MVCQLDVPSVNLVFLAMGVLQSIAACTLSMLLRSIRRYYVVGERSRSACRVRTGGLFKCDEFLTDSCKKYVCFC